MGDMEQNNGKLENAQKNRENVIVRTSLIGIIANLFLAGFKAVVGILANSIAVTLDAVNNLSDALSSIITIIGTKLAGRRPDKKHPLGHGRIEYLSAMIVSAIVLYAGIAAMVESVKKIINPETPDYSTISLVVICTAIVVKIVLGRYVKSVGKRVNSGSLIASGSDALNDAILSVSVLASAVVFMIWGVSLEAYVGVIISLFIMYTGYEMLTEALDEILGKRVDGEMLSEIKKTICEEEPVGGAYDLILHSYGPDRFVGSVHVEIPDTMRADEIDRLERRITQRVFEKHGVLLAGIGIYSMNTKNDAAKQLQSDINHRVMSHEGVLQTHGFYLDEEAKTISLDIILDYALTDREKLFHEIERDLKDAYPDFNFMLTNDIDI